MQEDIAYINIEMSRIFCQIITNSEQAIFQNFRCFINIRFNLSCIFNNGSNLVQIVILLINSFILLIFRHFNFHI